VTPAFSAVLKRMLAKRPEDRFRTPDALALALSPYARAASNISEIDYQELVRVSKLRGSNDSPSAWTFGSLSVSTASRLTLFPPSETVPRSHAAAKPIVKPHQ
jgi:hypothetical protein